MADRKISEFSSINAAAIAEDDLVPVTDVSAASTAAGNKNTTISELRLKMNGNLNQTIETLQGSLAAETLAREGALTAETLARQEALAAETEARNLADTQEATLRSAGDTALDGRIDTQSTTMTQHIGNLANPHEVTKTHVGLGNVDNTSDADKPISMAAQAEFDAAALERRILHAVQQVLAVAGVFPLGENSLGIAHGITDNKNRLLWGQRPSGTTYEGQVVREVLGENNLDLLSGTIDANGRILHGIRRSGGFFAAGLANDPLYDNNLDLVGNVVVDADDRVIFGLRSDGSLLAYVATVNTRWEMFPLTGQSLAEGGANAAITTTPPYDAEVAAKFSNGPVGKQAEVIGPGLVALAEQVNETISTGMARRVLGDHPDIRLLMAGQAWGGKTIAEISLGAADGIYEKILAQMDVAAALAPGAVIRAVGMINGEADGIISTPDFDAALESYRRQFTSDVADRLAQVEVPFLMTCQTSAVAGYRGGSIALRDSFLTPFAQLRAGLTYPNIVLVGPKYHLVYIDHAHIDALSTRLWGEKYGQVWRHLFLNNQSWLPVHAKNVTRDNDAIVLDLHSPVGMPIEIDNISVTDPGDLGFNLLDAAGVAINSVTQTGDFQITVECSGNVPNGSRLSYAFHNGIAGTSGWNTGARGCIRDSDATRSIYTGTVMPNWLCAFQTNF